jgi:hypothetical protein
LVSTPGEPICSAGGEAASGANPGDAPARQEVDIPDDYFISDDDLVDDEEPTRQDDEDDLF